ncbi:MAG: RsmB/NOP family class I SAM-dependent RNA methyltransferase [Planctomycetaceae bacterium]|nr:RsmB/NOP family class I SAM-dependent RNA methyltransferase [Planctomycetaceae bacterium]
MSELPVSELPEEFVDRLQEILPAERIEQVMATFVQPKDVSFRVNTLLTDVESVLKEVEQLGVNYRAVGWCPEAFSAGPERRQQLVDSDAFRDGRIYIQNLSSLLPVLLLDPQPEQAILDLAAAPGGKTLHLAARMQNRGRLAAVEVVRARYYKMCQNLRTGGASMVRTFLKDGRVVGNKTPEQFDRVLLDAPCSSEARFRLERPESWQYWGPRKIREQARKQNGLLKSAVRALKPGGRLCYCTCSFAPEENEVVVDRLLRREDSIELVPVELPPELAADSVQPGLVQWRGRSLSQQLLHARRILPSAQMSGFFLCLIEKSAPLRPAPWRKKRR